jgi:hypothetical protein
MELASFVCSHEDGKLAAAPTASAIPTAIYEAQDRQQNDRTDRDIRERMDNPTPR